MKNEEITAKNGDFVPDNQKEQAFYEERALKALELVDDIVLKNYLCKLQSMKPVEHKGVLKNEDFMLFKINKMVYEKDEYATDKFISVVNAMTYANCSICLIVDGKKNKTDFYLGAIGDLDDKSKNLSYIAETFQSALKGQFPGIQMTNCQDVENSPQTKLLEKMEKAKAIS